MSNQNVLTIETSIDVSVLCSECGNPLHATLNHTRMGDMLIEVEPCEYCLKLEYKIGVGDGKFTIGAKP